MYPSTVMFPLVPHLHTVPLCPVREPSRLSFRSSPRTSALAVGERETALGSPPCGHRAHTYTHTPFPQRPGITWTSPLTYPVFSLWSPEPQYPPPDHPDGAGSETIGRKPITHTKVLLFPSFYVCCVPPTYDTHTCIRLPLLLSRLPCSLITCLRVCVFSIALSRKHGALNFGTLHPISSSLLSFDSTN